MAMPAPRCGTPRRAGGDGPTPGGPNLNQGAEPTLALISTLQPTPGLGAKARGQLPRRQLGEAVLFDAYAQITRPSGDARRVHTVRRVTGIAFDATGGA